MTRILRAVLSAIVLSIVLTATAHARCEGHTPGQKPQNVARDVVGQDLDTIRERGWIEFAVYEEFAPYSYKKDGKPAGVDIEIGRLIAAELGVEPRFYFVTAGENLDADLRNFVWKGPIVSGRVANVMLHVPYDSEYACRFEQVVFTGQYASESIAIAYRKDAYPDEPPVPAYFRYDTVAVENDSIADFYLSSFANGQLGKNVRRFATMEAAMTALATGDVMAAMGPLGQLEFGLTDQIATHQPPLPGFTVGKWTIGLAVNFRYRPLAYAVDDAVRQGLEDGRIAGIYKKFGMSFGQPER